MYIIHNHIIEYPDKNVLDIGTNQERAASCPLFSTGIHPKLIDNTFSTQFNKVKTLATYTNCAAIGECGLDIFASADIATQKEVFRLHVDLARALAKPLIIHCVRAYSEIISVINKGTQNKPVILHSYNGNIQQTIELIKRPYYYFSFSDKCLTPNCGAYKSLDIIPLNRILIETDNSLSCLEPIVKLIALKKRVGEEVVKTCNNQVFAKCIQEH